MSRGFITIYEGKRLSITISPKAQTRWIIYAVFSVCMFTNVGTVWFLTHW